MSDVITFPGYTPPPANSSSPFGAALDAVSSIKVSARTEQQTIMMQQAIDLLKLAGENLASLAASKLSETDQQYALGLACAAHSLAVLIKVKLGA